MYISDNSVKINCENKQINNVNILLDYFTV